MDEAVVVDWVNRVDWVNWVTGVPHLSPTPPDSLGMPLCHLGRVESPLIMLGGLGCRIRAVVADWVTEARYPIRW